MPVRIIFLVVVFTGLICSAAQAQDITKTSLKWTITNLEDMSANAAMSYECEFKTDDAGNVQWIQKGNYITNMSITEVIGSWQNVNENGTIVYKVNADGDPGEITFERTSAGIFIKLILSPASYSESRFRFTVSQVIVN